MSRLPHFVCLPLLRLQPVFVAKSFEASVLETASVGTTVAQVIASDADSGENGRITYSLVAGNVDSVFNIDHERGTVFLDKALDVRLQPEYHLVIKASDSGEEPKSSFCYLKLVVLVPDHVPPKFDRRFMSVDVSEAAKVGQVIYAGYKVFSRQTLNYQLIASPQVRDVFKIDVYGGEITLLKRLDYERVKKYEMTIKATNSIDQLSDTATLMINVVDANDNAPKWNKTKYYGHVAGDALNGSLVLLKGSHSKVLTLEAYDADSGSNGELEFYINEPHGRKHFSIDPLSRTLSLKRAVDFERVQTINFTVRVTDLGQEPLMGEPVAHVFILVTAPDPVFETKSFSLDVSEDTPPGHILFKGIHGYKQRLFFELIASSEDRKHLSIDASTGEVRLSHPLDFETKKDLKFVVSATKVVGTKDSASFHINIIDANDCSPKWNKSVFSGHISEDAEAGSLVLNEANETLTLEAYDEDSGRNGRIEYYINEPHGMEYFTLNAVTGVISLRKKIEYVKKSTVIFTVRVTDLGDTQLIGEPDALVVVTVDKTSRPTTTTTSTSTTVIPPDPCLSNPCLNGGICVSNMNLSISVESEFNCSCTGGFLGDLCQESAFICSESRPCKNRGICQEFESYSTCDCQSGFQGDLCEEDVDECALSDASICPPPANCINLPGSYRCICSPYLVNGSSHLCGGDSYHASPGTGFPMIRLGSSHLNISLEAVIGVICILFVLILTCCCLSCCWSLKGSGKASPSRNRTPPTAYSGPEANEFLKVQQQQTGQQNNPQGNGLTHQLHHQGNGMTGVVSSHHPNEITLKRFTSKTLSRASDHQTSTTDSSNTNLHTLHLHPGRPLSLNNFDNIRVVGIVAEEGEIYSLAAVTTSTPTAGDSTLTRNTVTGLPSNTASSPSNTCSQDQRENFQRELLHKKSNPPIVTVIPQVTCNAICVSSSSSSHSGSKGKIQNGRFIFHFFFIFGHHSFSSSSSSSLSTPIGSRLCLEMTFLCLLCPSASLLKSCRLFLSFCLFLFLSLSLAKN